MTTRNKSTLTALFETGDIPSGTNYADFIDSCVNQAETSAQNISSPVIVTELITPRVSAVDGNFSGTVNAAAVYGSLTSANAAYVYDLVVNNSTIFYNGVVSATGSTQVTAASAPYIINRIQGVSDGVNTGVYVPVYRVGLIQYFINETVASANIYPPTGAKINALSANAPLGIAAQSSTILIHTTSSTAWSR